MALWHIRDTKRLPKPEVLEITTMCGHHQVSSYLVEDLAKASGRKTDAARSRPQGGRPLPLRARQRPESGEDL
jgi:hypothetical protein